jgi:hypothetical protein
MAKVKRKPTPVSKHANAIALKGIPYFNARGMKLVHGWGLTRMTEFSVFYTYHGEIWGAKDDRLLVRFSFRNGLCRETYEISGMTCADLFNSEFDRGTDEAEGLKGNIITLRMSGKSITLGGSKGLYFPAEENFWLSWVPPCVREAWDWWINGIEDN